jgi:disulfide bond formation protein DsbB
MAIPLETVAESPACCPGLARAGAWGALLVAGTALAGSLALSLHLQLQACPLCIYERTFLMGVVSVLALGLLSPAGQRSALATGLALPLAVAGLGVAVFHVWLELRQTLVCPFGLGALGTAPQQSLAAYGLVVALLLVGVAGAVPGGWVRQLAGWGLGGIVLGALLAFAAVVSGPKLPQATKSLPVLQAEQAGHMLTGCAPVLHEAGSHRQ